jgi:AmmeMemoRadiSam system protein B/AmmeMemoRadiSam system protein A
LATAVDRLVAQATPVEVNEPLVGLIVPHAGYAYSGTVAAKAFSVLKGRRYSRVVVIAPSHYESFGFAAVYDGDAYVTPLGSIPVDKQFAARLAHHPLIKLSSRGHTGPQSQNEHALEVELPFLQRTLGSFALVPIVMGEQSYDVERALGLALAGALRSNDTLIVASSDLSHFHTYDVANALDQRLLRAIQEWDYLSVSRNLERRAWEACGGGPIVAAMIATERLGATEARLLTYANTGNVTGDRGRVVGYGAVALLKSSRSSLAQEFSLSQEDRSALLASARGSVEAAVLHKQYRVPPPRSPALLDDRAAFVTITRRGELRGCIGHVAPIEPLHVAVKEVAALAATSDPRFSPVSPDELRQLHYEISVLSPFRRVLDVKRIRVGRDGLLIKRGGYEGILLPQVPVEQHWDRETFLQQACLKAGLPASAWRDPDTDVFSFSALVFGEN